MSDSHFLSFIFKIYLCMRERERARAPISVSALCACRCLQRPEQCIESPGAGLLSSIEPPDMVAGNCSLKELYTLLNHLSSPYECFCCFVCFFNVCDCFAYLYVYVRVCLVSTEATRYQIPWDWSLSCH